MKWILGGCALVVLAAVLIVGGGLHFAANLGKDKQPFLAPGSYAFAVETSGTEEPQTVCLWHDYRTNFQDKFFSGNVNLSGGVKISLQNAEGKIFSFQPARYKSTESNGTTSRILVGKTELAPGKYTVTINGMQEPSVFSIAVGSAKMMTISVFVCGLVGGIPFGLAGLALVTVGIIKLARGKKVAPAAVAPPL